jgi:DNA-binding MarR family transcriptional regulator
VGRTSRVELLGSFLAELREFSLSLTEIVELAQGHRFSSNAEVQTLVTLGLDGARCPTSLAAETGLTGGGMTNLLDRLEAAGLVRREKASDGDRRNIAIRLTPEGAIVFDLTAKAVTSAISLVGPLLEHWRRTFSDLDFEIGDTPLHRFGRRAVLERIRDMTVIGAEMSLAFAGAFEIEHPSPITAFHILWMAERDGSTRPREIVGAERLSRAGVSETIRQLEHAGFVERTRSTGSDGRAVHVVVTERGRGCLEAAIEAAEPAVEQWAHTFFPL